MSINKLLLFDQVVSEKQLVKQLQREVARLEAELRTPEFSSASTNSEAILLEKEMQIKKVFRNTNKLLFALLQFY